MLTQEQKNIILHILAPFQPSLVGIFGSYARNEAKKESDIDIIVDFEKRYSLFDLIDLEEQLAIALHCKIDLVTSKAIHPSLKKYIEKDLQLIA